MKLFINFQTRYIILGSYVSLSSVRLSSGFKLRNKLMIYVTFVGQSFIKKADTEALKKVFLKVFFHFFMYNILNYSYNQVNSF